MAQENGDVAIFPRLADLEEAFELTGITRSSSIPSSPYDHIHGEPSPTAHVPIQRSHVKHKEGTVDFRGYFQHQSYFRDYEHQIQRAFQFKKHIKEKVDKIITPKSIGVHCRRGDYEDCLDISYYKEAVAGLKKHGERAHIIVCSDDIEWCKEHLEFDEDDQVIFSPFTKATEDLALLTACPALVMSNSTFSWWAGWLGDHPRGVIVPWPWFGSTEAWNHPDALKWNDTKALIHPTWTMKHRNSSNE